MVKGVLGGNLQHHIHWALELGVPLVILPVQRTHGVQVADLYMIVKTKHIGGEVGKVSNQDKLASILSSSLSYSGLIVALGSTL